MTYDKYEHVRNHIIRCATQETGRGIGTLNILAARTKLAEHLLWSVAKGDCDVDEEIAEAVAPHIPIAGES